MNQSLRFTAHDGSLDRKSILGCMAALAKATDPDSVGYNLVHQKLSLDDAREYAQVVLDLHRQFQGYASSLLELASDDFFSRHMEASPSATMRIANLQRAFLQALRSITTRIDFPSKYGCLHFMGRHLRHADQIQVDSDIGSANAQFRKCLRIAFIDDHYGRLLKGPTRDLICTTAYVRESLHRQSLDVRSLAREDPDIRRLIGAPLFHVPLASECFFESSDRPHPYTGKLDYRRTDDLRFELDTIVYQIGRHLEHDVEILLPGINILPPASGYIDTKDSDNSLQSTSSFDGDQDDGGLMEMPSPLDHDGASAIEEFLWDNDGFLLSLNGDERSNRDAFSYDDWAEKVRGHLVPDAVVSKYRADDLDDVKAYVTIVVDALERHWALVTQSAGTLVRPESDQQFVDSTQQLNFAAHFLLEYVREYIKQSEFEVPHFRDVSSVYALGVQTVTLCDLANSEVGYSQTSTLFSLAKELCALCGGGDVLKGAMPDFIDLAQLHARAQTLQMDLTTLRQSGDVSSHASLVRKISIDADL